MNLLDIIFPELSNYLARKEMNEREKRRTVTDSIRRRAEANSQRRLNDRIESLENEVAQAALVIQALLEKLEEKDVATLEEIHQRTYEIDARDGVIDGKITPEEERHKPEESGVKFNFPDE